MEIVSHQTVQDGQVEEGQPEILVEIDRDRAAAFGIEPRQIAATVEDYMRGSRTDNDFVDFDEKVPVIIRLPEEQRRAIETLNVLQVDGIPLRELVRTRETVGPAEIRRIEQARTVAVFADVAQGGLDGALADAEMPVEKQAVPGPARRPQAPPETRAKRENLQQQIDDLTQRKMAVIAERDAAEFGRAQVGLANVVSGAQVAAAAKGALPVRFNIPMDGLRLSFTGKLLTATEDDAPRVVMSYRPLTRSLSLNMAFRYDNFSPGFDQGSGCR